MQKPFKVLYLALFILAAKGTFADEELTYKTMKDNVRKDTKWKIEKQNTDLSIYGEDKDQAFSLLCTPQFFLSAYQQQDKQIGKEVSIKRQNNKLIVSSKEKKREKTKTYDIKDKAWIQEFKFGFQSFLSSTNAEYKFCIVNPKDLDIHDMIATKEAVENITIEGKNYTAQKIKVTLQGFRKRFWKAEVWFDKESLTLLKYRANEGPGTPMTEVTLLEKNPLAGSP